MNRDDIIRMAREAGFVVDEKSQQHQPNCIFHTWHMIDEVLARFAALVAAAERREWHGLTDEEVLLCLKWDVSAEFLMIAGMPAKLLKEAKQEALEKYRAIEAALKEKNNG